MSEDLNALHEDAAARIASASDATALDAVRVEMLGKTGRTTVEC